MTHSLLIGGTKGLGRVVARQFAQRGDSVSVFGRSEIPINDQSAGIVDSYKLDIIIGNKSGGLTYYNSDSLLTNTNNLANNELMSVSYTHLRAHET